VHKLAHKYKFSLDYNGLQTGVAAQPIGNPKQISIKKIDSCANKQTSIHTDTNKQTHTHTYTNSHTYTHIYTHHSQLVVGQDCIITPYTTVCVVISLLIYRMYTVYT